MKWADSGSNSASSSVGTIQRVVEALTLTLVLVPLWLLTRDLFAGSSAAFAARTGMDDGLMANLRAGNAYHAWFFYEAIFAISRWTGVDYLTWVRVCTTGIVLALFGVQARAACRLLALSPPDARWLALSAMLTPVWYTLASSDITAIVVWWCFMLVGWWLFAAAPQEASAWRQPRCWLGFALISLSFTWPSLAAFALALQACLCFVERDVRAEHLRRGVWIFLAAVLVYAWLRWGVPPSGYFAAGYNNVLLFSAQPSDWVRMVRAAAMFGTWLVVPLTAVLLGSLLVLALSMREAPLGSESSSAGGPGAIRLVAFGAFLLAAASSTYVLVGKGPPLFTPRAYGQGITEQLLRAAHDGWFAPTWANTSGRHAFLVAFPLAALCWGMLLATERRWSARPLPSGLRFAAIALAFAVWLVPSYHNKLSHQAAELSLVKGLKTQPAPPPGIVSLRYEPVSDWFIGPGDSNMIAMDAWGDPSRYTLFHGIDAAERELQWIYHAYFKAQGGLIDSPTARFNAVSGFPGESCVTQYVATLPALSWVDTWLAGVMPHRVPAAGVDRVASRCDPPYAVPNPMPDKRIIP
jgi:hypothetical protein